ncbi:MAG: HAMP domain-containing protein [Clostridia bacterium]|nr:HAMP domain-containing protein [Clostridia bacterium]
MFKSLYFKIVLILLIFIVAVMCAVSAILINGVSGYFTGQFGDQMEECFHESTILYHELKDAAYGGSIGADMKEILSSYGSILGIDAYRNYYILDEYGYLLAGSDTLLGTELTITPNILAAMDGRYDNRIFSGTEYADWAVPFNGGRVIVYVKDSLEEVRLLNQVIFSIILQAMFVGILIAILLSFFLAKAITSPIQRLTHGARLVAQGDFTHPIEVNSSDELGVLTENFNYMKDQLKETLEAVSGEREKLQTVLACMRDSVFTFAANGSLLHWNNSAEELYKEHFDKAGVPTLDLCLEEMDIPLQRDGKAMRLTSPEAAVERSRDGFIFRDRIFAGRVFDVSFGVIRYSEGGKMVPGCIVIAHDVTGRYELDESRREFVANVSHELRTPLTSIKGATETVLSDPEMDGEMREYFLGMILSESDRMTRIVSDLLVLSRLDNKRTKWQVETFDMPALVRRLCEVMRTDLEAHGHEISCTAEPDLPSVTGDRQRLEQVMINIISNAIKYTPEGGRIGVNLFRENDRLVTTVRDNGVGIPEEDMGHLFERFYRVEKSRTSDAGGTGLGLAIAKELVEAHGGRIAIHSRLNEGTEVRIELPFVTKLKNTEEKQI